MNDDRLEFVAQLSLFAGLDATSLDALAGELEPVELPAGSLLIEEGDTADCLYILSVGRLRISTGSDEHEHFIRELSPGAIVGEMALLTDQPRTANVRAVRDCQLLRLRERTFAELVERHPSVLRQVSRVLVSRLVNVSAPPPNARPITIVVAPAGRGPGPYSSVARALGDELSRRDRTVRIDAAAVDAALGEGASTREPGSDGWSGLAGWLGAIERDHDQIVYETESGTGPWTRTCLRQADLILLVGASDGDPAPNDVERLLGASPTVGARRELVLAQREHAALDAAAPWLDLRDVGELHHLRHGSATDVARLARIVRGEACSIVLSGGGPRGFAHLGALRALEEAGVPFDYIAGTSIGAVVGALAAQDLPHDERMALVPVLARRRSVLDFTLPLVALATGKRVNQMLAGYFGATRIEDLPRSFVCVSADLVRAEPHVHDRGELWAALRASLSLPGIFPPVSIAGELLVDGATLDNLPIGVARSRLRGGYVVAVDLFPGIGPYAHAPGTPAVSGWRELGQRVRYRSRPASAPPLGILDVISRSNALAGVHLQRTATESHGVDLHLQPPLPAIGAFDFKGARPFVELGYRHTSERLEATGFAERFC